ncbi:hypothetical protein [Terriglobus tenax]|uniref:hypothetical protein n=1 Tax=Terriglobus tenax TaxID=1111115 RepID=UPI0021DF45C2|nr:hypothetical protein [Terriglobus tenax]
MGLVAAAILTIASLAYIFWPSENSFSQRAKSRLDYLRERKDAIYENLRDLNFEYKAGKYPEEDYATQRGLLENEAANIMAEMDTLERA